MDLAYREATETDLAALVGLLADDALGQGREIVSDPLDGAYLAAFEHIDNDPNNSLVVVEADRETGPALVGMLQLTFIPYLTHQGSWRCLIEGVRIHSAYRGQGLGEQMFSYAVEQARRRGCQMVQLTSDKQRPDAIRFYEKLGFVASHEGFKLTLSPNS